MRKKMFSLGFVLVLGLSLLVACGAKETGKLVFVANGEDFVRQGFVSKDGWWISFEHVYVNLVNIHGYQADPPYDAHVGGEPEAKAIVNFGGSYLVDLAEGGEDALPILVDELADVPAGHYNAISWEMANASEGPAEGYALVLIGTAQKGGQVVAFVISIEQEYEYICGEYVGDERKGFLSEDGTAELEMTFHFDHVFGDGDLPLDDDLNLLAPGFQPFADLVGGAGGLRMNLSGLEASLSPQDYRMLLDILPTLGHVGEGHCYSEAR